MYLMLIFCDQLFLLRLCCSDVVLCMYFLSPTGGHRSTSVLLSQESLFQRDESILT